MPSISQSHAREGTAGRILLVDDEVELRRGLARFLRTRSFSVTEVSTGAEALDLVGRLEFDAVVSDVCMPDMSGLELLRALHGTQPELPVLLLSGTPEPDSSSNAEKQGAFVYMTKPPDLERLGQTVSSAVEQRRKGLEYRSGERPREARQGDIWTGALLGGRYRVGRLIGEGGMGAVYEAVREDLANMRVAIKVLHPTFSARPDLVARFRREAETVAALDHPNIVRILDFQTNRGEAAFLVMERLNGESLARAIGKESGLAPSRVVFIASQVLAALGAAHSAGVVHRDLKPDNVFLTTMSGMTDIVKLLDFGIAKLVTPSGEQRLTQTGVVLGTPPYMAPEHARGGEIDRRADLYAVGCVMYEALTGRPPFSAENYNALLFAIQETDPRSLLELRPDVDPELAAVITRAMQKEPAQRFQDAESMARTLSRWVSPRVDTPAPNDIAFARTRRSRRLSDGTVIELVANGEESSREARPAQPAVPTPEAATKPSLTPTELPARASFGKRHVFAAVAAALAVVVLGIFSLWPRQEIGAGVAPLATAAQRSTEVRLHIRAFPGSARITIDERAAPSNPYTQSFRKDSSRKHRIVAEAPGYRTEVREMVFDQDEEVVVALALQRLPEATAEPTRPPPPAAAARPPRRAGNVNAPPVSTPSESAAPAPDCNPPHYFDENGLKKYKPQCLQP
jgi:serine/threonine protein kinase/CheY-like chemotaxis protein